MVAENTQKKIAINTITSWINMFSNAFVLIFLAKYLLHILSEKEFGMFQYVISLQSTLLFLDMGLGSTVNRFVSHLTTTEDYLKLNKIVSFVNVIFVVMGVIAVIIMTILGSFLPYLVIGGDANLYNSGFKLIVLIGITMFLRFLGYAPCNVLYGIQRYDIVNMTLTMSSIVRASLIVISLNFINDRLLCIGICFIICAILETGVFWIMAYNKYQQFKWDFWGVDKEIVKEVLGFSIFVLIVAFTTMLINNSPTILAGKFLGAKAVTYVSIPILVLGQVQRISGGFAFPLVPVVGSLYAKDNTEDISVLWKKCTQYCAFMCFPIGGISIIFGQEMFEWFREGLGWTWVLLGIMMYPLLFRTTQRVSYAVMMGLGFIKPLAIAQICILTLILILTTVLCLLFDFGIYGIVLGNSIPLLLLGVVIQPLIVCKKLDKKYFNYMCYAYGKIILLSFLMLFVGFICKLYIPMSSLIYIAIFAFIFTVTFYGIVYRFMLAIDDRNKVKGFVKSKMSRNKGRKNG